MGVLMCVCVYGMSVFVCVVYECVRVCVCVCAYECSAHRGRRGHWIPGAGITDDCKLLAMGAGNTTWVLCEHIRYC